MGTTPNYQIPYPEPGDPIAAAIVNLQTDLKKAAVKTDEVIKTAISGVEEDITTLEQNAAFARRVATAPFEGAVGDEAGRPSWLQYDGNGLPTEGTAAGLEALGVAMVTPDGDGFTITDEDGDPSWLSVGPDGKPDASATAAIANTMHYYAGPEAPFVYPGNWVLWIRTDFQGTPIETLIGRN